MTHHDWNTAGFIPFEEWMEELIQIKKPDMRN